MVNLQYFIVKHVQCLARLNMRLFYFLHLRSIKIRRESLSRQTNNKWNGIIPESRFKTSILAKPNFTVSEKIRLKTFSIPFFFCSVFHIFTHSSFISCKYGAIPVRFTHSFHPAYRSVCCMCLTLNYMLNSMDVFTFFFAFLFTYSICCRRYIQRFADIFVSHYLFSVWFYARAISLCFVCLARPSDELNRRSVV